jgi:hypothetical protein
MPVIRLEVSGDLAELLDAECTLLGFESREEYVRWVVRNRAAIAGGADRDKILAEYAQRVREIRGPIELESGAGTGGDPEPTAGGADASAVDSTTGGPPSAGAGGTETSADGGTSTGEASADGGAAVDGMNLTPRAERIADDTVTEAASELKGVQGDAFDELARRAVKRTREQLGEGTGSGLEYESSTTLDTDGARPGEDITDLDALEVPGYDDELVARRREAVGAALAHLRDHGQAKKGDFVEAIYEDYPAGYESGAGWWDCIKRGLRQVDRVDGAGDDSRIWRFRDYQGRVRVLRD